MRYDRIQQIKKLLLSKKRVLNSEICEMFNVSIETIRRDLDHLEKEGIIRKVYGGAVLVDDSLVPDSLEKWDVRYLENLEVKKTIASQTAALIPDNCTVLLDTGTSAFEVACQLKNRSSLTIVTNSLRIATELGMCRNLTVYCVGGIIKVDELVTSGFLASEFLSYFNHFDIAVLSADGFIPAEGTAEYSMEIAMLKKNMLDKSDKIILAIDHTKFGISANCITCPTGKINTVVTDKDTPQEAVAYLRKRGVNVIIADNVDDPK